MDNNPNPNSESMARARPVECKIWQNPLAQVADQPGWRPYTVGIRWRDGMIREGSFSIDVEKLRELQETNPETESYEQLLMRMIAQTIEAIFDHRERSRAAEKASKLILPGHFTR